MSKRSKHKIRRAITAPFRHLKKLGFTNRLALYLTLFLALGLTGGYQLAVLSIQMDYVGSLICWTAIFSPLGIGVSVVLARVVDKNRDENTSSDGDGIKYAQAKAMDFTLEDSGYIDDTNPPI